MAGGWRLAAGDELPGTGGGRRATGKMRKPRDASRIEMSIPRVLAF